MTKKIYHFTRTKLARSSKEDLSFYESTDKSSGTRREEIEARVAFLAMQNPFVDHQSLKPKYNQ